MDSSAADGLKDPSCQTNGRAVNVSPQVTYRDPRALRPARGGPGAGAAL